LLTAVPGQYQLRLNLKWLYSPPVDLDQSLPPVPLRVTQEDLPETPLQGHPNLAPPRIENGKTCLLVTFTCQLHDLGIGDDTSLDVSRILRRYKHYCLC